MERQKRSFQNCHRKRRSNSTVFIYLYLFKYFCLPFSGVGYYLSSCVNPLLYSVMSKRFRRGFADMFKTGNKTTGAGSLNGANMSGAVAAAAAAAAACGGNNQNGGQNGDANQGNGSYQGPEIATRLDQLCRMTLYLALPVLGLYFVRGRTSYCVKQPCCETTDCLK